MATPLSGKFSIWIVLNLVTGMDKQEDTNKRILGMCPFGCKHLELLLSGRCRSCVMVDREVLRCTVLLTHSPILLG